MTWPGAPKLRGDTPAAARRQCRRGRRCQRLQQVPPSCLPISAIRRPIWRTGGVGRMTARPALPKRLLLGRVRAGVRWMRIHAQARNALWFGPARGQTPIHRFDGAAGRFRVCCFATTLEVCFAETFLRNPPIRIWRFTISLRVRRDRGGAPRSAARADYGASLARLGMIAEVACGSDYALSQLWSRALWEHSDQPDGILYRSRHDDSALCVALFDRAKDALAIVRDCSLEADSKQLARLLRRYGLGLTN